MVVAFRCVKIQGCVYVTVREFCWQALHVDGGMEGGRNCDKTVISSWVVYRSGSRADGATLDCGVKSRDSGTQHRLRMGEVCGKAWWS